MSTHSSWRALPDQLDYLLFKDLMEEGIGLVLYRSVLHIICLNGLGFLSLMDVSLFKGNQ